MLESQHSMNVSNLNTDLGSQNDVMQQQEIYRLKEHVKMLNAKNQQLGMHTL